MNRHLFLASLFEFVETGTTEGFHQVMWMKLVTRVRGELDKLLGRFDAKYAGIPAHAQPVFASNVAASTRKRLHDIITDNRQYLQGELWWNYQCAQHSRTV